jgi:hypothetical protein
LNLVRIAGQKAVQVPVKFNAKYFSEILVMRNNSKELIVAISVIFGFLAALPSASGQTAHTALETYDEGPVWQIMTFRTAPGRTEMYLKNIATVWEHQLKLAVEKDILLDYKVLTKWSASPSDWNVMVIEIFPNMGSYDSFWEDWAEVDSETVDTPEFKKRFDRLEATETEFLGTVFAREVRLKEQ